SPVAPEASRLMPEHRARVKQKNVRADPPWPRIVRAATTGFRRALTRRAHPGSLFGFGPPPSRRAQDLPPDDSLLARPRTPPHLALSARARPPRRRLLRRPEAPARRHLHR